MTTFHIQKNKYRVVKIHKEAEILYKIK